jgi:YidC/Oxa1 family membrane protein insertase
MNDNQPTDQKRLLMAVALSAVVIMAWSLIFPPQKPVPKAGEPGAVASAASGSNPTAAGAAPGSGAAPASNGAAVSDALAAVAESLVTLEAPGQHILAVTNRDGQVHHWDLAEEQYRTRLESGTEPFRFVQPPAADATRGVFLPPDVQISLGGQVVRGAYEVRESAGEITARYQDPARRVSVERVYRTGQTPYSVDVTVRLRNEGAAAVDFGLNARLRGAQNANEASAGFMAPPIYLFEGICARSKDVERHNIDSVRSLRGDAESLPRYTDGIRFAAIDNRYFMSGFMPGPEGITACDLDVGVAPAGIAAHEVAPDTSYIVANLEIPGGSLAPGATAERTFRLYGGPKKLDALSGQSPSLSEVVDFGILSPLCVVMVSTLRWFHGVIPNWAVAIILLTLVVKILTLPLTHKQYKSMAAMKAIQPQLKEIQEKYKDDRMRLQQEMMGLYKVNGVNPLAGCLPVVAMMPVYIALYRTIYSSVELYHAPLGLWIHDLSERDPTYILPVLLGVVFLIQARLNPPTGDAMQQKLMTTFMPILFTAMMLFLPSGLVVYILCNTLLGIAQQAYMNKVVATPMPAPAGARGRT